MGVYLHRDEPRLVRDIAADHENDAELTDRMCKPKDCRGNESGSGERQRTRKEVVKLACAQGRCYFHRPFPDSLEGILDRLDDKRHGIKNGGDDEPLECERQRAEAERVRQLADRAMRPRWPTAYRNRARWAGAPVAVPRS